MIHLWCGNVANWNETRHNIQEVRKKTRNNSQGVIQTRKIFRFDWLIFICKCRCRKVQNARRYQRGEKLPKPKKVWLPCWGLARLLMEVRTAKFNFNKKFETQLIMNKTSSMWMEFQVLVSLYYRISPILCERNIFVYFFWPMIPPFKLQPI